MKPLLKPPGTQRLKLNCDILLSTSAFNFNLRRYIVVANCGVWSAYGPLGGQWQRLHRGEAGAAALAIINCTANLGGLLGPVLLGRGLHSSAVQLNVSAFCGIGGAFMDC